jgi:hemolysin activation/secretion protein
MVAVILPEQEIDNGVVRLNVIENRIGKSTMELEKPSKKPACKSRA